MQYIHDYLRFGKQFQKEMKISSTKAASIPYNATVRKVYF